MPTNIVIGTTKLGPKFLKFGPRGGGPIIIVERLWSIVVQPDVLSVLQDMPSHVGKQCTDLHLWGRAAHCSSKHVPREELGRSSCIRDASAIASFDACTEAVRVL